MLACNPPPPEHPNHHPLRTTFMSTTMTHLTGAGPLGPLAHTDVPPDLA